MLGSRLLDHERRASRLPLRWRLLGPPKSILFFLRIFRYIQFSAYRGYKNLDGQHILPELTNFISSSRARAA